MNTLAGLAAKQSHAPHAMKTTEVITTTDREYPPMKRLLPSLVFALTLFTTNAPAADWSFWRGPEQNGVSSAKT